jgi:hypothetical protein
MMEDAAMSDHLLYRRQFLLGSEDLDPFPTWARRAIAGRYRLSTHPDLPVTHAERGDRSLTLLGYVLDPDDPAADDAKILEGLHRSFTRCADLPTATSRLGGRWVMVAHDGERTVLFHDAAGLRQVYYHRVETRILCASQPGLLAEVAKLPVAPEALDYVRSRGDSDWEVYWLPGDRSPYDAVRALLPNHLLDVEEGKVARYWPASPVERVSYDEGLHTSARLLRGLLASARRRYDLAVPMTAGWDSRLVLALGRETAADLYCYTLTYPSMSATSRDLRVPGKLLAKLGLDHHVVDYPEAVDASFKDVARRSSSAIHTAYCRDAQALREAYPAHRLCVTGDVAEVVKRHYRLRGRRHGKPPTARDLGRVSKVGDHPFALAAFESWLAGVPRADHLDLLDLFCWEQMAGRWQAQIRAEYDIVQESFAPLDCRALLVTMLGIDETYRSAPRFRLFADLIELLWSDLLTVPINPREKIRWGRKLLGLLARLHLYQLIPQPAKELGKRILRRAR